MNALKRSSAIAALCVAGMAATALGQTAVVYVDIENGSLAPPNMGQDGWGTDAHRFLQDALDAAEELLDDPTDPPETVEIWVAAGTYRPDQGDGYTLGNRNHSFELEDNVTIYGGFPPDPHTYNGGQGATIGDRDASTHITILSGDLNGNDDFELIEAVIGDAVISLNLTFDNYDDNSQSVVRAPIDVGDSAILDGFTIQGGYNANGVGGAGVLIENASPTLRNCIIQRNFSNEIGGPAGNDDTGRGGGIRIADGLVGVPVRIEQCTIRHNDATGAGGGIWIDADSADVELIDCTIERNTGSSSREGASGIRIDCDGTTVAVVNCRVLHNFANQQMAKSAGLSATGGGTGSKVRI